MLQQEVNVEVDEPSSIIIDTKNTLGTGAPVMTKQQKEEFMRKNLGDQMSESSNNPEGEQQENGKNQNGKNSDNKNAG